MPVCECMGDKGYECASEQVCEWNVNARLYNCMSERKYECTSEQVRECTSVRIYAGAIERLS